MTDTPPVILVVDDDARIRELLTRLLDDQDMVALSAKNADQAKEILSVFAIDLMILDIMMPGQSGLELTEKLQDSQPDLPILLLSAKGEVDERITGLKAGADDYLPKPFDTDELLWRIRAILNRTRPNTTANTTALAGGRYDPTKGVIYDRADADGGNIHLTHQENTLLSHLVDHAGQAVTRDGLLNAMGEDGAKRRTVDVQITRLRKKIEPDPKNPVIIQTRRGVGYICYLDNRQ